MAVNLRRTARMYLSDRWLHALDRAYSPRGVTSEQRAPLPPPPAAAGGGLQRLHHGAFGRTQLGVERPPRVGAHPISQQVDQIHGYLSRQNLAELCASTGFSRAQLLGFWLQYKSLCTLSSSPLGVDLSAFRKFVPTVTLEDSLFVERVFQILDRAGSTLISWPDFLEAMSCLGTGDKAKRAAFIFSVYDRGGRGELLPLDLFHFFSSSLGIHVPQGFDPEQALARAEEGLPEGMSPLEVARGPAAKLLACAIFSQKAFFLLDPMKQGCVTLDSVLQYLGELEAGKPEREVGAVFGRSMLTSLESETKDIMSGAHRSAQDARAGERITFIKAHKLLLEEILGGQGGTAK